MEKMRQWTTLTIVAVVAVLAAGWFLLVSPQKSQASDLRTQASTQQSANASLQSQVNQLEQQKKGLPAQQRLLDKIATQIPANPELPTLIRQLSAAAKGAGVDLVSLAPAQPTLVTATAAAAPAPAPAATTDSTAPTAAAPAAPAAPAGSPLAQIPLTVQVSGSYFNITNFFHSVEKLSRAMLVTQFTIAPGNGGSGAKAADTTPDSLNGQISAVVFESPEAAAAATSPVTPVAPSTQTSAAPAAAS